nr:uncharacterized protein LOC116434742 [Nomia melanderi]
MKMLRQEWLLILLIAGAATAMILVSREKKEESLTGALDAITRKQRSLDAASQDYYNDLRPYKYHDGDTDRKFDREQHLEREIDPEDEQIEFLPNEAGQLETVGNGYQDLNNKLRERAIIDYLESVLQREEPVTSPFRERERGVGRKRGNGPDLDIDIGNKKLAKLLLEGGGGFPYDLGDADEQGYMDGRQPLYDRYRANSENEKDFANAGPMSWGELLNKESLARGQNVEMNENELADRDQAPNLLYLSFLAERKAMNGGNPNGHDYRTYRNMAKRYPVAKRSPQPLPSKKQVTDPKVAQERKKASFMPGQGTQNQDDEWMLQHYFENVGENLQGNDEDYRKEKLNQMIADPNHLKNMDNLFRKVLQKVTRKAMAYLIAAAAQISLENTDRKDLKEKLKDCLAGRTQPNQTFNFWEEINPTKENEDVYWDPSCSEMEKFAPLKVCRTMVAKLNREDAQKFYQSCVMWLTVNYCTRTDDHPKICKESVCAKNAISRFNSILGLP